ncbi:MAG: hypothetical protein JWM32_1705 [Verrucomicrobia bacterium]|nr:hypothetical protein [Verrucomicrobiota bacterium]
MNQSTTHPADPVSPVAAISGHAASLWNAHILATPEPALLSRVMQKLTCHGAIVESLSYTRNGHERQVEIKILFTAPAERAHLLKKQWETLINLREVALAEAQEFSREIRK